MLTEQGLYKVLMKSRKPIAEKFQDWVCEVIEEIRKTGEYKSNKVIEQQTKNTLFIEQYQNKPILYLGMVEDLEEQQIVKYGYTQDTKSTLKRHQLSYGEDFHYVYVLESKEHYNLENQIQNHNDLSSRHIKKYNGKDRQELLRLDKNFNLKNLIELIVKMKTSMEDDRELQLREIELEEASHRTKQEQEKTKQEQEKTKQMEMAHELEMRKLEIQLEIKKLELQQSSSSSAPVSAPPKQLPVVRQLQSATEQPDSNKDIVKKFLQCMTISTRKSSDYVFIDDLYEILENWLPTNGQMVHIPRITFGAILKTLPGYIIKRIAIGPRVGNATPRKTGIIYMKLQ
jgi:hypothetical protein